MFSANSSQVSDDKLFVEDVFSTYLYTGNGSTQTITNGINLSGQGGMVWIKRRDAATNNLLYDTARGPLNKIESDGTAGQGSFADSLTAFNSNGFTLGNSLNINGTGVLGGCSWTFRKAPKFFDVVTYTGDGVSGREIAHNLGVAPGCIIIKRTDTSVDWIVWHRGNGTTNYNLMALNLTDASTGSLSSGDLPTATTFKPGALLGPAYNSGNNTGGTYVAYLFAHDTTSDGIIQCGSYTGTNAAGNTVTLGWEPQWVLIKNTTNAQFWGIYDNMRGMPVGSNDALLVPNSSGAEQSYEAMQPTATGFQLMNGNQDTNASGNTYIYIAIRRGPMRTPTSGTSVFEPVAATQGLNTSTPATSSITDDLFISSGRASGTVQFNVGDRLRGSPFMYTQGTVAETSGIYKWDRQTGVAFSANLTSSGDLIMYHFRRAPSFFDEVCYTGTGSARTINHNLGVAPELIITKCRSNGTTAWMTYCSALSSPNDKYLFLNQNSAVSTVAGTWKTPTATTFGMDISFTEINNSGFTYAAYLFASCPGVSKVGGYTGNGSSQTINCGFAAGARFVMIKRTDSTGDWYVWDSARGIVSGNDPRLSLNSTAAEVTADDSVDTDSSGFVVNQLSATNINVSSATYIYLAVA